MRKFWLSLLLLCAAPAGLAAQAEPQQQFVMVEGAGNAYCSAWAQENNSAPRAYLAKEPEYKSAPIYFNLELGDAKDRFITLALDESGGPGKGYDTLYADANNDGDLTEFPPIKLEVQQQQPQFWNLIANEPVPLTVRYCDGSSRRILAKINLSVNRWQSNQTHYSLNCRPTQHVEGKVKFGEKWVLVGIYATSPPNGSADWCFDDYGINRLRIDLKGDGKLTDEMPLSKVVSYDGKLWTLEVNSAATQVTAKPCDLPSGPLKLLAAFSKDAKLVSSRIELANHTGVAISARPAESAPAIVPAGKYRIASISMVLADAAGRNWEASFSCPRTIEVAADTGASLSFTMPLKVEPIITATMTTSSLEVCKLGGQLQISYSMLGPGGEKYGSIGLQGARVGQHGRILDSEGIEVVSGAMEYG